LKKLKSKAAYCRDQEAPGYFKKWVKYPRFIGRKCTQTSGICSHIACKVGVEMERLLDDLDFKRMRLTLRKWVGVMLVTIIIKNISSKV